MPSPPSPVCPRPGDAVTVELQPCGGGATASPIRFNFVLGAAQVPVYVERGVGCLGEERPVHDEATGTHFVLRVLHLTTAHHQGNPLELARMHREKANNLFRAARGRYKEVRKAIVEYNKALEWIRGREGEEGMREMEVGVRNNLAICYYRVDDWIACVAMCEAVLRIDHTNRKALYRRGLTMGKLDWAVRGLADLKNVRQLELKEGEGNGIAAKLHECQNECTTMLKKRRHQFAEIYNVMPQSHLFENPLP